MKCERPDLYLTVSAGFGVFICRGQQRGGERELGAVHVHPQPTAPTLGGHTPAATSGLGKATFAPFCG